MIKTIFEDSTVSILYETMEGNYLATSKMNLFNPFMTKDFQEVFDFFQDPMLFSIPESQRFAKILNEWKENI